jgi:hypothetical membrane protein
MNNQSIYLSVKANLFSFFRRLGSICLSVKTEAQSFISRLNMRSALAFAGILGPLMLTGGDLYAGLSSPGYSMVRHSISSLALSPLGWLQTIGFLALGLLVEIFTAGLLFNVKRSRWFLPGIAALLVFGFGMLVIGAFATDLVKDPKTIEGTIHGVATAISFSLFPVALFLLALSFKKDSDWRHLYRYTIVACVLSILIAITLQFFEDGVNYFGLVERILVANMIIWVEVMAVNLLRLSVKRGPRLENQPGTG